jgi:hypothetical protein
LSAFFSSSAASARSRCDCTSVSACMCTCALSHICVCSVRKAFEHTERCFSIQRDAASWTCFSSNINVCVVFICQQLNLFHAHHKHVIPAWQLRQLLPSPWSFQISKCSGPPCKKCKHTYQIKNMHI